MYQALYVYNKGFIIYFINNLRNINKYRKFELKVKIYIIIIKKYIIINNNINQDIKRKVIK